MNPAEGRLKAVGYCKGIARVRLVLRIFWLKYYRLVLDIVHVVHVPLVVASRNKDYRVCFG